MYIFLRFFQCNTKVKRFDYILKQYFCFKSKYDAHEEECKGFEEVAIVWIKDAKQSQIVSVYSLFPELAATTDSTLTVFRNWTCLFNLDIQFEIRTRKTLSGNKLQTSVWSEAAMAGVNSLLSMFVRGWSKNLQWNIKIATRWQGRLTKLTAKPLGLTKFGAAWVTSKHRWAHKAIPLVRLITHFNWYYWDTWKTVLIKQKQAGTSYRPDKVRSRLGDGSRVKALSETGQACTTFIFAGRGKLSILKKTATSLVVKRLLGIPSLLRIQNYACIFPIHR